MAIRYDKKLNQEINRTIRNFNQKIARLEKQERELLPSKITKKELKESVYTRQELQRKLKELQRFSKRGAEDIIETKGGVKLTKYELGNLKKDKARIKQKISREKNKLEKTKPKVFGKEQSATFSQMGDSEYLNLISRYKAINKDIEKLNIEEFKRYKKIINKTKTNKSYNDYIFRENFFEMFNILGYYAYDNEKMDIMNEKFKKLTPSKLLKLITEEKSMKAILTYYGTIINDDIDYENNILDDVTVLYDALYENIDEILNDYT